MNHEQLLQHVADIRACLQRLESAKEGTHDQRKYGKRSDTFSQICSMYAIIAIFFATLGVGLMSFMHDTYVARPNGTPPKLTDDVSTVCLIFSVLFSISSSIAIGFGASPTLLLSLPTKDGIRRSFVCFLEEIFPTLRTRKVSKKPAVHHLIDRSSDLRTPTLESMESMRIPRNLPWNIAQCAVKLKTCLRKDKQGLLSTEIKFVMSMLLAAVLCMAFSLVSLSAALLVFAWAELSRIVAIFVTLSVLFLLVLALGISIIYKFTLLECYFKKNDIYIQQRKMEYTLETFEGQNQCGMV